MKNHGRGTKKTINIKHEPFVNIALFMCNLFIIWASITEYERNMCAIYAILKVIHRWYMQESPLVIRGTIEESPKFASASHKNHA